MDVFSRRFHRLGQVLCCAGMLASMPGCVQRRMTIRSNPPGALVYVDDYEIGTTPVSTDYIYYGTRKIRLVKDGYETLTIFQPMPTPWYQWFGLDFISENLWPAEIRDERAFDYQMQPAINVPTETLLGRAEQLRGTSRSLNAPPVIPVGAPPPGALPAGPPVISEPLPPPSMTLPPQLIAPPSGTVPSYGPPGGAYPGAAPVFPEGAPAPYSVPPSEMPGAAPIYGPPGAAPQGAPAPFQGPAAPPGWRPITSSKESGVWR